MPPRKRPTCEQEHFTVTCPDCKQDREVLYNTYMWHLSKRKDFVCKECGTMRRIEISKMKWRLIYQRKKDPILAPCDSYIVESLTGRCEETKKKGGCPYYDYCLEKAAKKNWKGWEKENDRC